MHRAHLHGSSSLDFEISSDLLAGCAGRGERISLRDSYGFELLGASLACADDTAGRF
jgi:hypothetical protein